MTPQRNPCTESIPFEIVAECLAFVKGTPQGKPILNLRSGTIATPVRLQAKAVKVMAVDFTIYPIT